MTLDALIVGQGLAGTSLAWELLGRGANILVVDRESGHSASSVAAGLVTPVTGRALSIAPDFMHDRAKAAEHYRGVEHETGATLWHERGALRLFETPEDMARLRKREATLGTMLSPALPAPAAGFAPMTHAMMMPDAARLDVASYLRASRDYFMQRHCYQRAHVDTTSLRMEDKGVVVTSLGQRCRVVILCGGSEDMDSPWLPDRALSPAKGEIITVEIENFHETRTTHCKGHWLLPTQPAGRYRFGATYDHDDPRPVATAAARELLARRLGQLVRRRFVIVDQQAGLRPVGADRRPVVGAHPAHRQVMNFNGLGSRGVLWAPRLARELAAQIHQGKRQTHAATKNLP